MSPNDIAAGAADATKRGENIRPIVHLIGGGGSAALLMRGLADAQIPFSIGALNIGDSDHALALQLAAEVISEQPYAPISPETAAQVRACLERAQTQILCPVPVGPGNLILLHLALEAVQHGLPTILLEPVSTATARGASQPQAIASSEQASSHDTITQRDYTNGEAIRLYEGLQKAGALITCDVSEAINAVKALSKEHSASAAHSKADHRSK